MFSDTSRFILVIPETVPYLVYRQPSTANLSALIKVTTVIVCKFSLL